MTLEERQQAVLQALKDIEARYGLRVVAVLQPEQYNAGAVMVKAALALDPVPGWTEAPPKGKPDGDL
jgi:hypothetical protein